MHVAKVWSAMDKLSITWKSDLSDKIKRIFPKRGRTSTSIRMHHMETGQAYRENVRRELHKNTTSYIEQIIETISHKTSAIRPPTSYL